jgi:hypothetical protein
MKVNTVGKNVSEAERAYTAGFLDGDGSIMATIEKHLEKKFGFRIRITVKITQRDENVLRWFRGKYKIGYIRKNRSTFDWVIRDQKMAKDFLEYLLVYLKAKRRQAEMALKILDVEIRKPKDVLKVARLADSLSKLNVRSKNRRKNFVSMIQEAFSRND